MHKYINYVTLVRGDTFMYPFEIRTPNGELYIPVEEDKIEFHLKHDIENINEQPIYVQDISYNDLTIVIPSEITKTLDYDTYDYDVQITLSNGIVRTIITDEIDIIGEVG